MSVSADVIEASTVGFWFGTKTRFLLEARDEGVVTGGFMTSALYWFGMVAADGFITGAL